MDEIKTPQRRETDLSIAKLDTEFKLLRQDVEHKLSTFSNQHIELRGDVDNLSKSVSELAKMINKATWLLIGGGSVIAFIASDTLSKILMSIGVH